ncbi:MAG: haloacid dehalogenase-like hydrolase [Candidatus Nanohaloarchaeota archaeon QJJ-5]|nr:haloacid dehalogenase-like hydrolase [Candidatus Nanohaloarchaeota archaeon QJJ-5]
MKVPDDEDRVVVFDLDGTLYEGHSWPELHDIHDVDPERTGDLLDDYETGKIGMQEWLDALAEEWGEPRYEKMDRYIEGMTFADGTHDLIEQHDDSYTVMLSGALDYVSRQVADELGIDAHVPTVGLQMDEQGFDGFTVTPYHNKEQFLDGLDDRYVIVYGNGRNDIGLVKGADEAYMVPNDARVPYDDLDVETGPLRSFLEDDMNGDG